MAADRRGRTLCGNRNSRHTSRNGIGEREQPRAREGAAPGLGDIPDTAPHAGLAGTPRPSAILHTLWGKKMSIARMTLLAFCLAPGPAALFIPRGLRVIAPAF